MNQRKQPSDLDLGRGWLNRAAEMIDGPGGVHVEAAHAAAASLRAAGWRVVAERPPRRGWTTPSRPRADRGTDLIPRTLWEADRG